MEGPHVVVCESPEMSELEGGRGKAWELPQGSHFLACGNSEEECERGSA
jgi:hypothetical protein